MTAFLLILHVVGFTFWLGGAFATMFASIAARREERAALATVVRIQGVIANSVVGMGALVTVVTGIILTFRTYNSAVTPSVWLMVMQGAGLVAGILTLALTVPTARRLARISPVGEHAAYFDSLRRRQKVVGMSSGVLAMVALVAGVMMRFGH